MQVAAPRQITGISSEHGGKRNVIAQARKKQRQVGGGSGGGFGNQQDNSRQKSDENREAAPLDRMNTPEINDIQQRTSPLPQPPSTTSSAAAAPLQEVSRERVLGVCVQTSLAIAAAGVGIRALAPLVSPAIHDPATTETITSLLDWTSSSALPGAEQLAIAAATAAGVTAARLALLSAWPEFQQATDASNTQALTPLQGPLDVALVSILPAISEELLFRGALLPMISPDWRGVAIAGAVFGALHIPGGRNAAFGVWATVVGCAYGAAFLATGSVLVPVAAHGLANVASASAWLSSQKRNGLL